MSAASPGQLAMEQFKEAVDVELCGAILGLSQQTWRRLRVGLKGGLYGHDEKKKL